MTQYLVTLSIGPVQDFIAAARRTRDLWMGSYLLSEISKAAAYSLYNTKINDLNPLIFPSTDKPERDLRPCKDQPENCFNVGNKLLALIETAHPEEIVKAAELAAQIRWEEIANASREKASKKKIKINGKIWDEQIKDVLECFASWVQFDPDNDNYKDKRARLDQLLNARKNTRQFVQNPVEGDGVAKSSLDGLRENVIKGVRNKWSLRAAGLNEGEYLDVTGIAKRLGGHPDQFTPISRLAIDPWLRGLLEQPDSEKLKPLMRSLCKLGISSQVKGNKADGNSIYNDFPYDGQLLYPFRLEAEKQKLDKTADKEILKKLNKLEKQTKRLKNPNGQPSPYMGILAADGDRMGELLDEMQTLQDHKNISATLSEFSKQVPGIVRKYRGHCIYAGGDDVLALLPLDTAIDCSHKLATTFTKIMAHIEGIKPEKTPTLSCGLGVSHFMTPLSKQLELARNAERVAKGNELALADSKNALAIIISPRSGAEITFRERWDRHARKILKHWIKAHLDKTNGIPRQAGYHLRDEAIALEWCKDQPKKYNMLIEAETRRIMERKQTTKGDISNKWITRVCDRVTNIGLYKASEELIMTRRIAEVRHLARNASKPPQESKDV